VSESERERVTERVRAQERERARESQVKERASERVRERESERESKKEREPEPTLLAIAAFIVRADLQVGTRVKDQTREISSRPLR